MVHETGTAANPSGHLGEAPNQKCASCHGSLHTATLMVSVQSSAQSWLLHKSNFPLDCNILLHFPQCSPTPPPPLPVSLDCVEVQLAYCFAQLSKCNKYP